MQNIAIGKFGRAGWVLALACLASQGAAAETVYKCVNGGKVNFTSAPKAGQACQPVELHVVQPNPEEVAREMEKKRLSEEEDNKERAKADLEKKQRQTDAALRRAKSAEDALRLLKDAPPLPGSGRSKAWAGVYPKAGGASTRGYASPQPLASPPEIHVLPLPLPQQPPPK